MLKKYQTLIILLLAIAVTGNSIALKASDTQTPGNPILGKWLVQSGDSIVEIYYCAHKKDKICGKIIWLRNPNNRDGTRKLDINNPNPSERTRSVIGSEVLRDFSIDRNSNWSNGLLYNGLDGRTYTGSIRIRDNQLLLSGCALRVFCRTQTWQRAR